jgi:hypothetical protein
MTNHTKVPQSIMKTICTYLWSYHDLVVTKKSIQKKYTLWYATMSKTSSMKGKGYGSFSVTTLSFQKYTQILNFPFFSYHNHGGKLGGFLHSSYEPCNQQFIQIMVYHCYIVCVHPIPILMGWWDNYTQFNLVLGLCEVVCGIPFKFL